MENLDIFSLWNVLGLVLIVLSGYMIATRFVLPRIASPWMSKRRRQEAIERAETLLRSDDLDDEMRHRLQRCLVTVRSYDSPREGWSGRVPIGDIVDEIDTIWAQHDASQT